ncbi:MAG: lysophospholipid acyltransferase family protein [Oligoflexia bacterium]
MKKLLIELGLTDLERRRIDEAQPSLNSAGFDDFGMDPETLKATLAVTRWIYTDYFRVKTRGIENVPQGRVLLISNHGGQIPIDGLLIGMAMLLEARPARMVRGMIERWVPGVPFVSSLFARLGQTVGDVRNCRELLQKDQAVLVFPEGVRGSGKTIFKRYQLQRFGTGFIRLALETGTPIVPVAVVGCEEAYPSILNVKWLARWVGAPYIPVTPLFPFLGPIGALPLPTEVTVSFGPPLIPRGDPDGPESEIELEANEVKSRIQAMLDERVAERGSRWFGGKK